MGREKARVVFTDRSVQCAKVGRTQVTGTTGLYLVVNESGSRRFIFRYVSPLTKRPNECKVGPYPAFSLKDACEKARAFQSLVAKGEDPVAFRRHEARQKQIDATTFGMGVDQYADELKARAGTANVVFLARYHARALLDLPIAVVTTADVRKALAPTQASHPKTARRALGAVATIFDYAKASDMRAGDNPASWEVFRFLWPPPPATRHMRSMPPRDLPAFYRRLIERDSTTALGLAFLILTAARTAEAVGGRWSEIDFDARLWVIPAERMKARREHRAVLSDAAMAILMRLRDRHPNSDYLFPAAHGGRLGYRTLEGFLHRAMGETTVSVHGFRASFSTHMHEMEGFAHEDIELCIAHQTGNAVSRSYNRATAVEKRRVIMQAWADHVTGTPAENKILHLRPQAEGSRHP